jgi:hypothetical protein
MPGHAFSLLEAQTINIENNEENVVKIFNPYNKNQYKGNLNKDIHKKLNDIEKQKLKLYPYSLDNVAKNE